jgi:hypothetical protein
MYVQYGWVFRWILAAIGGLFLWFTLENLWPAITNEQQLVAVASYLFAMLALLPWPAPGP